MKKLKIKITALFCAMTTIPDGGESLNEKEELERGNLWINKLIWH